MIDQRHRRLDRADGGDAGRLLALDHDHIDPEFAGRRDLAIGGAAAGILGDNDVDVAPGQQSCFVGFAEWPAGENVAAIRCGKRRIDRIDAAHEIAVPGGRREAAGFLPADSEEDAARLAAECGDRRIDICDPRPAIAGERFPGRTAEHKERNARSFGRAGGIGRDLVREGMRGIDKQVDLFLGQVLNEPLDAAKTAYPGRQGQGLGIRRASGKRDHCLDILPLRQPLGQPTRFGRAAEDQDTGFGTGLAHG